VRNQPFKFRISFRLARAIHRSPLSATELAFRSNLTATRISEFLRGDTFGEARRQKVLALAELVGVDADHATVRVVRVAPTGRAA
jgi:transcriptional regulator with XRE-family HTH domain